MNDIADKRDSRWPFAALLASILLCLILSVCYWLQPDWLAALTLVPAWVWFLPAAVLVRLGFWSFGFWRDHRDNRVKHRRQVREAMTVVDTLPASAHIVVGGDFNAPAATLP